MRPHRPKFAPATDAEKIALLHQRIRQDILLHSKSTKDEEYRLRTTANRVLNTDEQAEVVSQIKYGCHHVDRLLGYLSQQTKDEEKLDNQSAAAAYESRFELNQDAYDEMNALRTLASDDTSLETSSVADYSADPPPGPAYSPSAVIEARIGIAESFVKILQSLDIIVNDIMANTVQWWASPNSLRRLKTHAIRMNYHARKIKKWGNQSRSHLFVAAAILTRTTSEATVELQDLKKQLDDYTKRRDKLLDYRGELERETAALRKETEELLDSHSQNDAECVRLGKLLLISLDAAKLKQDLILARKRQQAESGVGEPTKKAPFFALPEEVEGRKVSKMSTASPQELEGILKPQPNGLDPSLLISVDDEASLIAQLEAATLPQELPPLAAEAVLLLTALKQRHSEVTVDTSKMIEYYRILEVPKPEPGKSFSLTGISSPRNEGPGSPGKSTSQVMSPRTPIRSPLPTPKTSYLETPR